MEQEYYGKKQINGIVLLLIVILVVGNVIFGGLFFYEKYFNENKKVNVNETNKSGGTDSNEIKKEVLDISSSIVKDVYNIIPSYDGLVAYLSAYQSRKMSVDNIDHEFLRAFAFTKLDGNMSKFPHPSLGEDAEAEIEEGWYSFDAKYLRDKMLELYNTKIEDGDFNVSFSAGVTYQNGKYNHAVGGGSSFYSRVERQIEEAYVMNDELVIEDEYLYVLYGDIDGSGKTKVEIYDSSDKKNKLLDEQVDENIMEEENLNKLISKCESQKKKYKHTFKKNDKDNYYWVSTEPVK